MKKILIFTICGVLIFASGFFAGGYWTALKLVGMLPHDRETAKEISPISFPENAFWENIFFGAKWESIDKMKPIPEGKGYLTGKIIFQGKPAIGIKFKLFLNSEFRTATIVTDNNGFFEVRLPPGIWYLNMIQCEEWENRPRGEFILLSGEEPRLDNSSFQEIFFRHSEKGKQVVVTDKKPEKDNILLTINPRIKTIWPKANIQNQQATIANSRIEWEAYPSADAYLLRIDKITRESKTSTIYSPILYRKVSGANALFLKDLPNSKGSELEEYTVTIKAYNQAGIFISESELRSETFTFSDGRILFSESL